MDIEGRLRPIRDPPCEKVFDDSTFRHLKNGKENTVVITGCKFGDSTCYALKIINLAQASPQEQERLYREIEINGKIRHPNIVEISEVYKNDVAQECTFVMELMEGGDLFDRVIEKSYDETEARTVAKGILQAVEYLHSLKIAHRDLKPENIVFSKDLIPKLIDFGFAKQEKAHSILETPIGTEFYVAPEVTETETYGLSVDMWSVGSILYFMLYRKPPFFGRTPEEQQEGHFEFPTNPPFSQGVKNFISNLLQKDPAKRMTATEALAHPWFSSFLAESDKSNEIIDGTTAAQLREDIDRTFAEERDTDSHTKLKITLVPARESVLWKKRAAKVSSQPHGLSGNKSLR